jgi:heme/copper-type cytochrome/quinol oxidase subunit 2
MICILWIVGAIFIVVPIWCVLAVACRYRNWHKPSKKGPPA